MPPVFRVCCGPRSPAVPRRSRDDGGILAYRESWRAARAANHENRRARAQLRNRRISSYNICSADVAQPEEQRFRKPQVKGSSPFIGSTFSIRVGAVLGEISISSGLNILGPICWTNAGQIHDNVQQRTPIHSIRRHVRARVNSGRELFHPARDPRWHYRSGTEEPISRLHGLTPKAAFIAWSEVGSSVPAVDLDHYSRCLVGRIPLELCLFGRTGPRILDVLAFV